MKGSTIGKIAALTLAAGAVWMAIKNNMKTTKEKAKSTARKAISKAKSTAKHAARHVKRATSWARRRAVATA